MIKFMYLDITFEPLGPGLPSILIKDTLSQLIHFLDDAYNSDRLFRLYKMPEGEGIVRFIGIHRPGTKVGQQLLDTWNEFNSVKKPRTARAAR